MALLHPDKVAAAVGTPPNAKRFMFREGSQVDYFQLLQNASARKSYPNVNAGPMEVSSSGGVKIIATHRFAWMANGVYTSITEMMGLPSGQPHSSDR